MVDVARGCTGRMSDEDDGGRSDADVDEGAGDDRSAGTSGLAPRAAEAVGRRSRRFQIPARLAVAAGLVTLAVVAVRNLDGLMVAEAELSSHVVALVMGSSPRSMASDYVIYPVSGAPGGHRALRITWQCSVVWAALPILGLSAALVLIPRVSWWRLLASAAGGVGLVVVVNQLRILLIAVASAAWGRDGYEISHRVVGSGLVIASVALGAGLIWRSSQLARGASRSGDPT